MADKLKKTPFEFIEGDYVGRVIRINFANLDFEKWYINIDNAWVEIDPDQLWFWTKDWQAGEQKAQKDLEQGQYEVFDSMDDFIDSL